MAQNTYWLPRGTVLMFRNIEIILDGETNEVIVDELDWPDVQRAHFPAEDCDDPGFDETEASMQADEAARDRQSK